MLKVSGKIVKPLNGYYMQQKVVRWQSKPSCENVACRTSTTLGLVSRES